ncbi:MAG: YitT family protein [Chloroflexota bacterium]
MQRILRIVQRFLLTYTMLTIGAGIGALAVMIFLAPNDIAPGGVSGIAVISNRVLGTPIGLLVFILNIPIQILAWRLLPGGWRNIVRAIYVISVYTIVLDYMAPFFADFETSPDPLLNAIFGGVLGGIGSGIVIRAGGNFGGTSTIALIIQRRTGMPLSSIYLYTDVLIIGAAAYFFSINAALLAIITLFMDGVAANYIMEGPSLIRTAFIVTDKPNELSQEIMKRLDRGMTSWTGKGMYTGEERTVLYISVARSQIAQLRRIVSQIDPDAFVVIGQGHTAYGEGFRKRIAPVLDMNDGSERQ